MRLALRSAMEETPASTEKQRSRRMDAMWSSQARRDWWLAYHLTDLKSFIVRDLETGTTTLVMFAASGTTQVVSFVSSPRINAHGRYVAFVSSATNLVNGFVAGGPSSVSGQLYLRDLATSTTTLVSHRMGAPNAGADGSVESVAMSADGRYLVFTGSPAA